MWVRALLCCVLLSPLFLLAPTTAEPTKAEPPAPKARPTYKSPLGLVVDEKGEKAYVALHTAGAVAVVDLKAGKVLKEIHVGKGPFDVAIRKGTLAVTCSEDDKLVLVDLAQARTIKSIPVGQSPRFLAWSSDKADLVVDGDGWERYRLEWKTGKVKKEAGGFELRWSKIRPFDTEKVGFLGSPFDILRIGARERNELPTTQVQQGWIFLNVLERAYYSGGVGGLGFRGLPVVVDEPQRGYADLADAVATEEGKNVFVSSAGANCILVVDMKKWNDVFQARDDYESLSASRHYVVARIPAQINPRRVALSGDKTTLVVSNYLSDSLTIIDTKTLKVVRHIPLGGPEPDAVRRGDILFNSGKMTFHGQFTCASCHPGGDSDGLTWDLTRDGIGNFKKTKSLLGVKDTAPYGWEGSSPTLEDRIAGTLRTLHQHEPEGTEVEDIATYLRSLPPPRPWPVEKEDQPAIARGEKLFKEKAQCAKCHQPPTFQDGMLHDIGTRGPTDTTARFDTPSLRGVSRDVARHPLHLTGYLHDGRAKTLEEVFTKHNDAKKHGAADRLSKDELADLLKYLSSL